uniref:Uncharacterized protein n=1 Tax=Arundo donax TaxID=35708 RepID=A0A0A9A1W6_ARUDO
MTQGGKTVSETHYLFLTY